MPDNAEKIGNPVAEGEKNMAAGKNLPVKKIIDLTELIEKGGAEAPSASQGARLGFIADDDDIEALLADT